MTCFTTASASAASASTIVKATAMSVPCSVTACRRDLQITPTPCRDPEACGSFCSDDSAGAWKQFRSDIGARPLMQQRRTERSHMIQQILQLLRRNFRVCLLSSSSAVATASATASTGSRDSQGATATCSSSAETSTVPETPVLVTLQTCSSIKLLVHLAKHLELLIYRAAFSKAEYSNVATLLRRVQHFAMVMNCNSRWKVKIIMKQQQQQRAETVEVAASTATTATKCVDTAMEEHKKKMWLFSPAWWESSRPQEKSLRNLDTVSRTTAEAVKQGVLINANDQCYRSIVAIAKAKEASRHASNIQSVSPGAAAYCNVQATQTQQPTTTQTLSPFRVLFQGHSTPVLLRIFSFLNGANVVQHFTLNRFCYDVLPRAISDLHIPASALASFFQQLEARASLTPPLGRRALLPNLQHLCVAADGPSAATTTTAAAAAAPDSTPMNDNSVSERKRKRSSATSAMLGPSTAGLAPLPRASVTMTHTVVASACPPTRSSTRTSGERSILALARTLGRRDCPQLRRLCLCSTFVNSFARNAIFHLTDAMSTPGVCPQLEYLWLGGNALGDYGAMRVARLLASNACPKLAFLDLRCNFIAQDGMRYLANALTSLGGKSALQQLCLGNNLITSAAFAELRPCFQSGSLRRLVFLGLDRNFLSRASLRIVADELLAGACPRLKELCVGGNAALTQSAIADVFREAADSTEGATWGLFRPRSTFPGASSRKRRRCH